MAATTSGLSVSRASSARLSRASSSVSRNRAMLRFGFFEMASRERQMQLSAPAPFAALAMG